MALPRQIDRYRVLNVLHAGEFVSVLNALHTVLGSQVALKVLAPGAPEEVAAALLQEGRIQAVVRHPHVLRVSDAFPLDGAVVLVMELVRGESLADRLEHGPIAPELVLPVFRGIARGVRAIHKRNIVHRDLKPENVLLEPAGRRYRPLVADFGLAKILGPTGEPEPRGLSTAFSVIGTPEYMAPEQAADPGRVDTRADLFSLGAMLYELVTGVVCFEADTDDEAIRRTTTSDYAPVHELAPDTPDALVGIINGLLKPRVEQRIATAGEVLRRIDAL